MGGIQGGHGERLLVDLKEVLTTRSTTQEGKAELGSGCNQLVWRIAVTPTNTPSVDEAEPEDSPKSLTEVAMVVKKLFGSKAPGVNELLKALDFVGLSWLSRNLI